MSEALLSSMIDKLDANERKMDELIERLKHTPDYTTALDQIENKVGAVFNAVQNFSLDKKGMEELSQKLSTNIELMKRPGRQEIVHHHHATKTIWIAAALFLTVCLEAVALYVTINNLYAYKANDTKYRYLKLQDNSALNKLLTFTDSLYQINGTMRDSVIRREEQNQRNLEILRRAIQLEKEAKELKKKANVKDNQVEKSDR